MYDLIVIGDDIASHVSAAYACHNGLSTLLIAETGLGGLQLIGDFVFNIDPTPLTGLGTDQLGTSALAEMGIPVPESQSSALNPAYQILLPEHRIEFFSNQDALIEELAREFPEEHADIREYYFLAANTSSVIQNWIAGHPQIQPQNIMEYFSYLKMLRSIFHYKLGALKFDQVLSQNKSLEKVWEAQQALLSFNAIDLFCFASAFQYCAPFRGVTYYPEGKQFLFNALVRKIESNKGSYRSPCQISSMKNNKTIELEIKSQDGTASKVSARYLIVSTKSDSYSLLRRDKKSINYSDRARPAKIAYYPFTLFLGVAGKCLPERLARHIAIVADVSREIYDNNLIILETSMPGKDTAHGQARTSISATVYLQDIDDHWTRDALKHQADLVLKRIDAFLPFLKENIALFDLEKSIDISLESRRVISPKYNTRNAFFTSLSSKTNKTYFKNIFLTGSSLLTDAGFDGEILSGKNAALQVMKKRSSCQ